MRRLTREAFEAFAQTLPSRRLFVRAPFQIAPCACRDVNCQGWRFVEVRDDSVIDDAEPVVFVDRGARHAG